MRIRGDTVIINRIERTFSGYISVFIHIKIDTEISFIETNGQIQLPIRRYGLANKIGKQTFTGERRPKVKVAGGEVASRKLRTTEEEEGEEEEDENEENLEKIQVKSWAGSRKRKGETKKSLKAKSMLPKLFDVALPDAQQDPSALAFLHDARNERKLHLEEEEEEEEGGDQEAEEEAGAESKKPEPFQTVGLSIFS